MQIEFHLKEADFARFSTPPEVGSSDGNSPRWFLFHRSSSQDEVALADGTVIRTVRGISVAVQSGIAPNRFPACSLDDTQTWGKPELTLDPQQFTTIPQAAAIAERWSFAVVSEGLLRSPPTV